MNVARNYEKKIILGNETKRLAYQTQRPQRIILKID